MDMDGGHAMVRRTVLTLSLLAWGTAVPTAGRAQIEDTPLDRWLVTSAEHEEGDTPLPLAGRDRFPDRNVETSAGLWTLVRQDGAEWIDLSEFAASGRATLAHAYLRSPRDADVRLDLTVEGCVRLEAWVNGQYLEDPGAAREVRLAAGWNTLLVSLRGEPGCDPMLAGRLSPGTGPNEREDADEDEVDRLRVQASAPPGVRPTYPEGVVTVTTPRVTGLTWHPERDDLEAHIRYDLASWGREAGAGGGGTADAPGVQRPDAPPSNPFDLPRRGGGGRRDTADEGEEEGEDDEKGPTDSDGTRARMVSQLLGRQPPAAPAPRTGSAALRLAGESFVAASNQLRPGARLSFEGSLDFRELREAALREDGVKAEFRWEDGEGSGEGRLPAAFVLRALHGPLDLALDAGGDGVWRGTLRVPEALAGFTLRGEEGAWTVDGAAAADRVLCSRCERNRLLEVEFRGAEGEAATARIVEDGFLVHPAESDVAPTELLRALEGDNRRYRALLAG